MLSRDGGLAGAGVLVSAGGSGLYVLTCAHVVTAAGCAAPDSRGSEATHLVVDLPGRGWSAKARLMWRSWSPPPPLDEPPPGQDLAGCGDFAALALPDDRPALPHDCGPLLLAPCGIPDGQRVQIIGYPQGTPGGIVATGQLSGTGGPCPRWVQIDGVRTTGVAVERGFSGAAVWDPGRGRVVGLITAAHTDQASKTAWMLPIEAAARYWPPLREALSTPELEGSQPSSEEGELRLADALLQVPRSEYDPGRDPQPTGGAPGRRSVDQGGGRQGDWQGGGRQGDRQGGWQGDRQDDERAGWPSAPPAPPAYPPPNAHSARPAPFTHGPGPAVPKYLVDAVIAVECLQDHTTLRRLLHRFGVASRAPFDRARNVSPRGLVAQLIDELSLRPEGLAPLVEILEVRDGGTPAIRRLKVAVAVWQVPLFDREQWDDLFQLLDEVRVPDLHHRYSDFLQDLGHRVAPRHCAEPWSVFLHAATLNSRPEESLPCFQVLRQLLAPGAEGKNRRTLVEWAHANDTAVQQEFVPPTDVEPAQTQIQAPAQAREVWCPEDYLIIRLRPLLDAEPGRDTLLSHWWRVHPGEQLRGFDRRIGLRQAEQEVRALIRQAESDWAYTLRSDLALEFVLPRDLLDLCVERWGKAPFQGVEGLLGEDHQVVLRSLERINRRDLHRYWARRWDAFAGGRAGRVHWFPEDGRSHLLSDPPPAVVVLSGPPGSNRSRSVRSTQGERPEPDELSEALRVGVPVILWDRRGERDPGFRRALRALLAEHDPRGLPHLVKALRTSADATDAEEYFSVGRHVALLWDDPERMPVAHTGSAAGTPPTPGEEGL